MVNKENQKEMPNVMKESYVEYLIKIGNELQLFIFGGVDSLSGNELKGFGARPTQQSKDPIVRGYGKKINKLQMGAKQLKNLENDGLELTSNQQKVIDILDSINSKYPPQIRLDDKTSAQFLFDYIYGKTDSNSGVKTEGIYRRPNARSNDEVEKKMGIRIQKLTKKYESLLQKMSENKNLTDDELEFIRIMSIINKDYPKAYSPRTVEQIMDELENKVRGYYNKNNEYVKGIERRASQTYDSQIENDWHYMNKWAKKMHEKLEGGGSLSLDEMDVLERIDKLNIDYPAKNVYSWLESAHIIKKYIYGTGEENSLNKKSIRGLNRRPSLESDDKVERMMASRLGNLCNYGREIKNAYQNGKEISETDKEIMSILYKIYVDFPSKDIVSSIKTIQDFVYGYEDENGNWVEGKYKRPAYTAGDPKEKKAAICLNAITTQIRNIREDTSEILEIENNRIVVLKSNAEEKLSKEDYMCMQMLRQLDKEYPSRKRKKRIDVLKFTDEVWKSNLDDCRNKDYITEFYQKERHAARNYLIEDR